MPIDKTTRPRWIGAAIGLLMRWEDTGASIRHSQLPEWEDWEFGEAQELRRAVADQLGIETRDVHLLVNERRDAINAL